MTTITRIVKVSTPRRKRYAHTCPGSPAGKINNDGNSSMTARDIGPLSIPSANELPLQKTRTIDDKSYTNYNVPKPKPREFV